MIWSHLLFESLLTPATRLYGFGGMYHEFIMLHNLQCLSFAPSIPLTLTLLTHVPSSPKDLTVDPHPFISSPLLCIQSPKLFCGWPLPVGAAKVVCFPLPEHPGGELGQIQPTSHSLNPSEQHTILPRLSRPSQSLDTQQALGNQRGHRYSSCF